MNSDGHSNFPPLSPVQLGGEPVQTVNARDLHAFLEVGRLFAAWLPDRIDQYGFIENVDYVVFSEAGKNPTGGRPAKEYAISLDMAKELSMVERNEKGKEARRYFIECEKRAKTVVPLIPQTLPEALRLAADLADDLSAEKAKTALMAPKVEAFDLIAETDGSFAPTDAAKTLGQRPRQFIGWLRMNRWTYRRLGSTEDVAYEDKLKAGLMVTRAPPSRASTGRRRS
jgi:anti-repressor protein